jgi:hypothetical protein
MDTKSNCSNVNWNSCMLQALKIMWENNVGGLLFDSEDGNNMLLRNLGEPLSSYTALQPRTL